MIKINNNLKAVQKLNQSLEIESCTAFDKKGKNF